MAGRHASGFAVLQIEAPPTATRTATVATMAGHRTVAELAQPVGGDACGGGIVHEGQLLHPDDFRRRLNAGQFTKAQRLLYRAVIETGTLAQSGRQKQPGFAGIARVSMSSAGIAPVSQRA